MGVDLKLLPLIGADYWAAHDMIEIERRRELWPAIEALPQANIPKPLSCFLARSEGGDHCYGEAETTPYGDRMKYTTAGDLLTLKDLPAVNDHWRNKAVWAYLAQMPAQWPIVLYWH